MVGLLQFASSGQAPSNVWMETPDVLAIMVEDAPLIPGNVEVGSFTGQAYGAWVDGTNPLTGVTEKSSVFGPLKDRRRFSDLPNPAGYLDKMALRDIANYTVTGATATAIYFRDEAVGQGIKFPDNTNLITQRHTIYIKLSAPLSNGASLTISNSEPNTFSTIRFTFNDKTIRAGGIQINQIGFRPDDSLKYGYLAVRIPGGPDNGTVDFAGDHGISSFQILDSTKASVFTGAVTLRVAADEREQVASFVGFIDDGSGGGSYSGVAGNRLTMTSFAGGFVAVGFPVISADAALSAGTRTIASFVSGTNGGLGVYTVSGTAIAVPPGDMWRPDGYPLGIDVADMSTGVSITAITKANPGVVTAANHGFSNGDKVRFFGINGMTQLEGPPAATNTSLWFAPTISNVTTNTFEINVNTTNFGTFANTSLLSTALGGVNNKVFKCFNTNRAGTNVYGLDYSSWTPSGPGTYYLYIPGYGISDPFEIASDIWAQAAAKAHEGLFNLRLGCAVSSSSGYSRDIAVMDGVNGCQNYESTLIAWLNSEAGQIVAPSGAPAQPLAAWLGATVDAGTLTITTLSTVGTTATANTSVPHGQPIGSVFGVQILGCTPTAYNTVNTSLPILATAATTTSFTYTVASGTGAGTGGYARTGFVTTTRTGYRPGHQDAGDNDDLGMDHLPYWKNLAMVFRNIPKPSRFTPFTVPLSSAVLDPVLFAGTDALPPLFHELFWHAETYRVTQHANGSVIGGYGMYTLNSGQVPNYPETIDYYRGTDAGGTLTGQTVMMFSHARDHYTTFLYAGFAAILAQIAYDYGLTTLGDTYRDSAIDAYAWADSLITDPATNDAYYNGTLNLMTKANWSMSTYQDCMRLLNTFNGLAVQAKADAAGSLYRAVKDGGGNPQTPYGNFIEQRCITSGPTIANAGSGYAVNDIVILSGGVVPVAILVTTVDGSGGITGRSILCQGQFSSAPTNPVSVASTTGSGTGAQFTLSTSFYYTQMSATIGSIDYAATTGANATAVTSMRAGFTSNNPGMNLAPKLSYMWMSINSGPNVGGFGYLVPNNTLRTLGSHINYVAANGVVAGAYSSQYLQVMQAHGSFIQGANFKNKAYQTGVGPRPWRNLLYQDSYKKGTPGPDGILPFGYYTWATSSMTSSFQGSLTGVTGYDGPGIYISDNVSGQFESEETPGSAKMWNPWRGGSSLFEWSPENHGIIANSEFSQSAQVNTIAMQLWMHGWDGNT